MDANSDKYYSNAILSGKGGQRVQNLLQVTNYFLGNSSCASR
ncbi:hypothetical protein NIES2111_60030 (plasmid) [Nostoc sp. NIES-2111]|nr:hypothetical protein NIES2111_60030 [Nostoc sp. NIES-2111]